MFNTPPEWELIVEVNKTVLVHRTIFAGEHLVAGAQELLQLQVGFGPERFGRLDVRSRVPIRLTLQPVDDVPEAGAMSTSDGLGRVTPEGPETAEGGLIGQAPY